MVSGRATLATSPSVARSASERLAFQAANLGMGLSTNPKNRVSRAAATSLSWFAPRMRADPLSERPFVFKATQMTVAHIGPEPNLVF
jgi:hypothetical protein